MSRPERPLDAANSPTARFADALRVLRRKAGSPTYRDLALLAHSSKASLSAAANGRRLPTWEVTSAFVRACDGDVDEWRSRWQATRSELGLNPRDTPSDITDSPAGANTEAAARFVGRRQEIADNADPKQSGCAADPEGIVTLDSVEVHTANQEFLGLAELRHSPTHRVAWGRFVPSDRMLYLRADATITIVARRPATGTVGNAYSTAFDGQAVYGDILLEEYGGIEATVTVDCAAGGGSATTACLR